MMETYSANTTLHALAAREALAALPPASCSTCKPVLTVMTVEPDIIDHIRVDPLLRDTFDIRRLPPAATAKQGHYENTFVDRALACFVVRRQRGGDNRTVPMQTRIDDTKAMLRDIVFLARRADASVGSMRSNIMLLVTQWTPKGKLLPWSTDEWFYALSCAFASSVRSGQR